MKILLINATSNYIKEKSIMPLGLLSIATHLTKNGHTVRIYDRAKEGESIKKYLNSFSPDIVGISVIASKNLADAVKISKIVKKRNLPVIWGGQLPTLIPELELNHGVVDYVVVGEGEITCLELITALENNTSLHHVDGLAFAEQGKVVVNKDREHGDLALLPIIDFTFIDPSKYLVMNVNGKKMLHTYSSKGCIHHCAYCYNPSFCKGIWRPRPIEYLLSEMRYLVDNYAIEGLFFVDDLLSPNSKHLRYFCDKIIESNIGIEWGCDMRADTVTKEELQRMHDAGCRWIFFGIESGSEDMQKKIKKGLNLNKAIETINYCKEIGITTTTSFIVGLPDETEEELKKTIKIAQEINSDVKIAFSFGPVPRSELYERLINSKRLHPPKSHKDLERLKWFDAFGENYSNVSTIDYKVITSYFYYSIFKSAYTQEGAKKRTWYKRLLDQTLDILRQRTVKSLYLVFLSGVQFIEIMYYAKMYPKVLKKYGLNKKL